MKKLFKNITPVFIIFILFSVLSCTNSYDELIDDFNRKNFAPEPSDDSKYSVTSEKFNPYEMLEPSYAFKEGFYINLEGPLNASSYRWSYSDSKGNLTDLSSERIFYYKTPGVFQINSNTLVLTVTATDKDGNVTEYIDKTIITIIGRDYPDQEE